MNALSLPNETNGSVGAPGPGKLLETRDIVVRFGGLAALDKVSIEVPPASLVGLVGPNGAGKTTLFGVCSGLQKPTSGRVFLAGDDVTSATPQNRARRGLARTFQTPEMFLGLTIRQHFSLAYRVRQDRACLWKDMFNGRSFRKTPADETQRVDALLELLALTELGDVLVDVLPLGMTRLVEVGRALASNPAMVLLDEPMSGLDANEAARLADALRRTLEDEKISLLLVEHDVPMVLALCSRIFVLDFGRLIADGTPDQIRNDPTVRAAYLGEELTKEQPA
jgi:branched-chain amino acid transport system ATP-binding protein